MTYPDGTPFKPGAAQVRAGIEEQQHRESKVYVTGRDGTEHHVEVKAKEEQWFRIGDAVIARSFGRLRYGVLVGASRTRVTVRIPRNATGVLVERRYRLDELMQPRHKNRAIWPWKDGDAQ